MSLTIRATKGSQLTLAEFDANSKEIGYLGADIASATTTDLNNVAGNQCNVTGTVTITGFGTAAPAGTMRWVRFAGALILTHHATNLILPWKVNFTTRGADVLLMRKEGAAGADGWRCLAWARNGYGDGFFSFVQFPAIYDNGNLGATPTISPTNGARQKGTTSATITTFTISAPPDNLPMSLQIDIYQAAGANYTWPAGGPASSKWPAGADKALTAVNAARDRLVADWDGGAWVCNLMKGIA